MEGPRSPTGKSRRASGRAGEKVARDREHSRPLARPLSRRIKGSKEEESKRRGRDGRGTSMLPERARSECARSTVTLEVSLTTPLLFWPLTQLVERGLSHD